MPVVTNSNNTEVHRVKSKFMTPTYQLCREWTTHPSPKVICINCLVCILPDFTFYKYIGACIKNYIVYLPLDFV